MKIGNIWNMKIYCCTNILKYCNEYVTYAINSFVYWENDIINILSILVTVNQ